jgi:hypothetical protein
MKSIQIAGRTGSALSIVAVTIVGLVAIRPAPASAAGPTASVPYKVSVFAKSVPGSYTKPDSIAVTGGHVFIGYGNGVATDGTDGKSSTIVEYTMDGHVVRTFSVTGHNDGLRVNPETGHLWALQNEDGNANLVIIDPEDGTQRKFTFGPTAHGGGYDDIAFRDDQVFISASNPANNPNAAPAIVKAQIMGTMVKVSPVLAGNASATDVATGTAVTLNLQDPDSMIFDPFGDLVLDSQSDSELIIVEHPGSAAQSVFHLGLTLAGAPAGSAPPQVDDTVFATAPHGVILVADRDGETVYSITRPIFAPAAAFTAAPTLVGSLDFNTGVITPVVTGFVSAHGMAFINAQSNDDEEDR